MCSGEDNPSEGLKSSFPPPFRGIPLSHLAGGPTIPRPAVRVQAARRPLYAMRRCAPGGCRAALGVPQEPWVRRGRGHSRGAGVKCLLEFLSPGQAWMLRRWPKTAQPYPASPWRARHQVV